MSIGREKSLSILNGVFDREGLPFTYSNGNMHLNRLAFTRINEIIVYVCFRDFVS